MARYRPLGGAAVGGGELGAPAAGIGEDSGQGHRYHAMSVGGSGHSCQFRVSGAIPGAFLHPRGLKALDVSGRTVLDLAP